MTKTTPVLKLINGDYRFQGRPYFCEVAIQELFGAIPEQMKLQVSTLKRVRSRRVFVQCQCVGDWVLWSLRREKIGKMTYRQVGSWGRRNGLLKEAESIQSFWIRLIKVKTARKNH